MRTCANTSRPRDLYNSLHIIPLYLFGHYDKAIEIGNQVTSTISELWSFRNSRLTLFYLSLSVLAKVKEDPSGPERNISLGKVREYKDKILMWQAECNVNYLMWSHLITAETSELMGDYHNAIQSYEAAVDHTQLHDFMLEQAVAFELQGEFFVRRGARRAARAAIMDAIATYSTISASGKVDQLTAKHERVLKSAPTVRTADVGIQTADTIGDIENKTSAKKLGIWAKKLLGIGRKHGSARESILCLVFEVKTQTMCRAWGLTYSIFEVYWSSIKQFLPSYRSIGC